MYCFSMATMKLARKTFKPREDPSITFSVAKQQARFRFNQDGIELTTDFNRIDIMPSTGRNNSVSAHVQVMVTVKYYATGKMQ